MPTRKRVSILENAVLRALRAGEEPTDRAFDRLLPTWARAPSRRHWTPVAVAQRAAALLVREPGTRVLDVGSGIGKFCLIGALTTEGHFTGIEQRSHLVQGARGVAARLGVERCRFIHGNFADLDLATFDAFYLFNPFQEHLGHESPLDRTIEHRPSLYRRYVRCVEERLEAARSGSRLCTYWGFGGSLPGDWALEWTEDLATGRIEVWSKS